MTATPMGMDPIAELDAARAQGLPLADPVRWAIVSSLARRAAAQQGPARARVLQRLDHWLTSAGAPTQALTPRLDAAGLSALSALVDRLGRSPVPAAQAAPRGLAPAAPAPGPLKAVAAYTGTWSRLRAEQRLRQALAQVPAKAGPLNSSQVVHRALQSLYELSPAYLDALMAHLDALMALEAASGGDLPLRPAAGPRRAAAESGARGEAVVMTKAKTKAKTKAQSKPSSNPRRAR